mmetsp:Transcript_88432/g.139742  ORF Transcript_88432/g.139742 Transcript_88432/m.139742 type:complete len:233 (-) Transcript_88432:971-1669(-)
MIWIGDVCGISTCHPRPLVARGFFTACNTIGDIIGVVFLIICPRLVMYVFFSEVSDRFSNLNHDSIKIFFSSKELAAVDVIVNEGGQLLAAVNWRLSACTTNADIGIVFLITIDWLPSIGSNWPTTLSIAKAASILSSPRPTTISQVLEKLRLAEGSQMALFILFFNSNTSLSPAPLAIVVLLWLWIVSAPSSSCAVVFSFYGRDDLPERRKDLLNLKQSGSYKIPSRWPNP